MGPFLTDCTSSVEQIRQRAAGSLEEQHARFCHRGEQEERLHPSLLLVKTALTSGLANDCDAESVHALSPQVKNKNAFVSRCIFFPFYFSFFFLNRRIRKTTNAK